MYLVICTRPDKVWAYLSNPTMQIWVAVKRIFRYLRGTSKLGLNFQKINLNNKLRIYSDADWVRCLDTRKSTTGLVVLLNDSIITYGSKKQSTVVLSTMESEYLVATRSIQEGLWISQLLKELNPTYLIFQFYYKIIQVQY